MYLALNTAADNTEIYVVSRTAEVINSKIWPAGRTLAKTLLGEISQLIGGKFDKLDGLMVFTGPGSFTGLRIGISTINAIAYAQNIPVVGVGDKNWLKTGVKKLAKGQNDRLVFPNYGAPAHITKPKK
jgi:tRNA threonylcarbamoyl adenosine modification protein YeaZ